MLSEGTEGIWSLWKDEIAARLRRIELLLKGLAKRVDAIDESIHELVATMEPAAARKTDSVDHSD